MSSIIKKRFKIEGMHCSSCAMMIDGNLEDIAGVKSARTSYARQECEIEYDMTVVDNNKIAKVITKSGYKVCEC